MSARLAKHGESFKLDFFHGINCTPIKINTNKTEFFSLQRQFRSEFL